MPPAIKPVEEGQVIRKKEGKFALNTESYDRPVWLLKTPLIKGRSSLKTGRKRQSTDHLCK
jgi:hypothetical protein